MSEDNNVTRLADYKPAIDNVYHLLNNILDMESLTIMPPTMALAELRSRAMSHAVEDEDDDYVSLNTDLFLLTDIASNILRDFIPHCQVSMELDVYTQRNNIVLNINFSDSDNEDLVQLSIRFEEDTIGIPEIEGSILNDTPEVREIAVFPTAESQAKIPAAACSHFIDRVLLLNRANGGKYALSLEGKHSCFLPYGTDTVIAIRLSFSDTCYKLHL